MNNQNRIYYIVGGTIGVGLILVLLIYGLSGGFDSPTTNLPKTRIKPNSSISFHETIEKEIDTITAQNVTPTMYTTLKSKISSGLNAGMYPNSIKTNLDNRLAKQYSEAVLAKINNKLKENPIKQNEINVFLSHLNSIGLASNAISEVNMKLKDYNYWTTGITKEVNQFTSKSLDAFNDNTYINLKNKLQQQSGINADIKKHPAVISTKNKLLKDLESYYENYVQYEIAMSNF